MGCRTSEMVRNVGQVWALVNETWFSVQSGPASSISLLLLQQASLCLNPLCGRRNFWLHLVFRFFNSWKWESTQETLCMTQAPLIPTDAFLTSATFFTLPASSWKPWKIIRFTKCNAFPCETTRSLWCCLLVGWANLAYACFFRETPSSCPWSCNSWLRHCEVSCAPAGSGFHSDPFSVKLF